VVPSSRINSRVLADRHAVDAPEAFLIACVESEAGDIVFRRIDQGAADNFVERQVCQFVFRRNRSRSDRAAMPAS